ncbi:Acetyltransferase (GNAT) family protein [Mucilaginibacter mallensis]|uniref:Acetyltransferase (GNAT) family protein n=1 Tax=Mucilaginibacter mallensis TaxID=652787 RepID=A0A1H1VLV6_MUCMA|nr:GNAT family N-acetyltransferase [Mucilaginibacter mallensis]SDS85371.1 Acetyltransferase (GNAT) family protein [Mucilaginibacter mallensis]
MNLSPDIRLKRTNNTDPDFNSLVSLLDKFLQELNGEAQADYTPHNKLDYLDTAVVIYLNDKPVGCGCFKQYNDDSVEIKRMFVSPTARGNGIASGILKELELWAAEKGFKYTVLETLKTNTEAVNLYNKQNYKVIDNYGPYITLTNSVCLRKELQGIV